MLFACRGVHPPPRRVAQALQLGRQPLALRTSFRHEASHACARTVVGKPEGPLGKRCASALLKLAGPYGLPQKEGLAIALNLSHDEFADMVGCSRPMANRELKQLEAKGLIRMTCSQFVIIDLKALRAVATSDNR
jgi:CRP-like cAMP-binding protein